MASLSVAAILSRLSMLGFASKCSLNPLFIPPKSSRIEVQISCFPISVFYPFTALIIEFLGLIDFYVEIESIETLLDGFGT